MPLLDEAWLYSVCGVHSNKGVFHPDQRQITDRLTFLFGAEEFGAGMRICFEYQKRTPVGLINPTGARKDDQCDQAAQ
ncbi:MAG: hypothetical protein C4293_04270 [Nitrospiraceae bacterium]